jgi:hypothetical protein
LIYLQGKIACFGPERKFLRVSVVGLMWRKEFV